MQAEILLLQLAADLAALPPAEGVPAALRTLAAAYTPGSAMPRAMAQACLQSGADKMAMLALGWARERLRLALEELLARTPPRGMLPGGAETRSWLILAACEAMALEPPSAVADRLRALLELTGHATDRP